MKKTNKESNVLKLTTLAMLAALAVSIGMFKFSIFPSAPFLEFDFADIPILIATLIFGVTPGLSVLFVVSLIQAFFLGGNGVIGLIMHFVASGAVVMIFGNVCRHKKTAKRLTVSAVLGTLAMTALMIPLNYIFIPLLFKVPTAMVTDFLPAIIPFNLLKAGVNTVIACLVWLPVKKIAQDAEKK